MKVLAAAFLAATISLSNAAIRLDQPIVTADRDVQLTVQGDIGAEYSVEWSVNLAQWNLVATGVAVNGSLTVHHNASNFPTIFYRAIGAAFSQTFALYPAKISLNVGREAVLLASQTDAAIQWSSSDPAIVRVETNGVAVAIAKGIATVTATFDAQTASVMVTVYDPDATNGDAYTTELLQQALANNTITAEQELIYRTYATFGDDRLPAQFRGAPSDVGDDSLLSEIGRKIDSLSPAGQQILRPFLLPPIYAESWYSQKHGLTATGGAGGGSGTNSNCAATVIPEWYPRISTAHFNIFYHKRGDPDYDRAAEKIRDFVAAIAEEVYAAETSLLGRFPLSDLNEGCNGGDGAVDIYIVGMEDMALQAQTVAYGGRCNNTPSFILLNRFGSALRWAGVMAPANEGRAVTKGVFAHEFMHVLQYAMDRNADCNDMKWFDEATAQWAIDFTDQSYNKEDGFNQEYPFKKRTGQFLTTYLLFDHNASLEKPGRGRNADKNGYADYIFFQFLARKYGDSVIKQIYDATAGGMRSVEAIEAGLGSSGGLKQVWPEFARTLWIDTTGGPLSYWKNEDQYDFGLQFMFTTTESFKSKVPPHLRTIEVDQKGEGKGRFVLLKGALSGGSYKIPARSCFYEHLKFTDETVHSVLFINPIAGYPADFRQYIKVYAFTKIGGQWEGPKDWTTEYFKEFCRDKTSERIEEMLLVFSNSDPRRPTPEQPFSFDSAYPVQVSTSNVGCWQWEGSASVLYESETTTQIASAVQLKYEVKTNVPGRLYFETTGGSATGSQTTQIGDCTITATAGQRVIARRDIPDSNLDYNLDLDMGDGRGSDREIVTLTGGTTISTQNTIQCSNFNQSSTADQAWIWLSRLNPTNTFFISADGQTMEANISEPHPAGGSTRLIFKFTAKREQ